MPTREDAPLGAPCWIELFSSDPDRSTDFYAQIFGWTMESAGEEYGGYFNFAKNGHKVAGGMRNDGTMGMPDGWSLYLATDNIDKVAEAVPEHGGFVMVPPMQVMELGSMAIVSDPGGGAIGAWQPGLHRGFEVFNEPGAPSWFELHTNNYDASVAFYRNVFGWDAHTVSDDSTFRYTTFGKDEDALAGIMDAQAFLPEGVGSHWSIYFEVDNVDATLVQIAELGGAVVEPAEDSPYGRLARAADPTGAVFKLLERN